MMLRESSSPSAQTKGRMWALSSGWGADGWRGVDAISEMLVVGVGRVCYWPTGILVSICSETRVPAAFCLVGQGISLNM